MTASRILTRPRPLFIFDGHCVLCSTGAAFIMRHDQKGAVQFTSAQSELGAAIYAWLAMPIDETYLLIDPTGCHTKSSGYFRLAQVLGGWWRLLLIGKLIPLALRDWLYDGLARNRYRWFGRTDQCALLTPEQRARLVTDDAEIRATLQAFRRAPGHAHRS